MRHSYRYYQIDAFTTEKFRGNPAGVIINATGLQAAQMQQIAREVNNSETAFIFPPAGKDGALAVRFFTPTKEVPICGHDLLGGFDIGFSSSGQLKGRGTAVKQQDPKGGFCFFYGGTQGRLGDK